MKKTTTIFTILLFSLFVFVFLKGASAQSANATAIITWHAENFYPANFEGKPLPTPGSKVYVSLGATVKNRLISLDSYKISWYLDGRFIKKGKGLNTFSFVAKMNSSGEHTVRVKNSSGFIDYSISIPVVDPEVVIETPYYKNIVSQNSVAKIKAVPYFFNNSSIDKLMFMWKTAGVVKKNIGNNSISIDVGPGKRTLYVTSSVQNQDNLLEYMNKTIKLFVN